MPCAHRCGRHGRGVQGPRHAARSKKPELEDKAELKQRLEMAARYKAKDRLAISPQCGFASTMEGNLLTEAEEEAKLHLTAEVAREVWV